jgi:hypothetical protein
MAAPFGGSAFWVSAGVEPESKTATAIVKRMTVEQCRSIIVFLLPVFAEVD